MSEEHISNLILERLNRIDKKLERLDSIEKDIYIVKDAVRRIDARIAYMDSYMAGFHNQLRWQQDEINDVKERVDHLEKGPDNGPGAPPPSGR